MTEKTDVVVVGMGPGGEDAAGALAEAGLDVVGIEKELVGGECPYWGCVPSKMMIRAANAIAEARRVHELAGTATVNPDWAPVARIRAEATDTWDDRVAVERFEKKGGRFVRGAGALVGPRSVAVDGRTFEGGRGVVIATGASAAIPPIPGLVGTPYWTNRGAIAVTDLPASLVVLGGGAIGLELAQVFARFGVRVTVVEALERLLPLEEPEAGALVADVLRREGIDVVTGVMASRVDHHTDGFAVHLSDGRTVAGEKLLVATGRWANVSTLGLEAVGLDPTARSVAVDARMRAGRGLWAVGDVTGKGAFTHVAMYQSRIATADILGRPVSPASYHALPRVTFTDPEVGAVGMTEQQARDQGIDVHVGVSQVPSSARGWIHKVGNEGTVKLIADQRADTLIGATSVGPHGGEVLSMLALAVHAKVPLSQLRSMIYAYPTFHRAIEDALKDIGA